MKKVCVVLIGLISTQAFAGYTYDCKVKKNTSFYLIAQFDFSLEKELLTLHIPDEDFAGSYTGTVDPWYRTPPGKNYIRFEGFDGFIDENGTQTVVISKDMQDGVPVGDVRVSRVGETSTYGNYYCTLRH